MPDDDTQSIAATVKMTARGWYGDPRGHSMASREGWENRRGESRSSRFQYDDDDPRGSAGGGHGGWFGDPQGHSEASRRGWEERR
jgi:hypothetical protein